MDTKVAHARKEVAAERSKTDAVRESAKLEKEAASHREAALSDEIRKLKAELSAYVVPAPHLVLFCCS